MSKADEMFEELYYTKEEDKIVIVYRQIQIFNHFEVMKKIYFYKIEKEIVLKSYNLTENFEIAFTLTKEELQAINEKCKELGWLDE